MLSLERVTEMLKLTLTKETITRARYALVASKN